MFVAADTDLVGRSAVCSIHIKFITQCCPLPKINMLASSACLNQTLMLACKVLPCLNVALCIVCLCALTHVDNIIDLLLVLYVTPGCPKRIQFNSIAWELFIQSNFNKSWSGQGWKRFSRRCYFVPDHVPPALKERDDSAGSTPQS